MKRIYLDSSAYVTLLMGDPPAAELERDLRGAALFSSVLLLLETRRALIHAARTQRLAPTHLHQALERITEDVGLFELRDLTSDLCGSQPMPVVSTPRAMDLAHLRTALWFHAIEPLARFVSLDEKQKIAARDLGLPVDPA